MAIIKGRRLKFRRLAAFSLVIFFLSTVMPSSKACGIDDPSSTSIQEHKKESQALEPGKQIDRILSAGDQHEYRITLIAHMYLKAVIEQKGIDLVVQVLGPDGIPILEFDSESRREGREEISLVAETTGDFRMIVRPKFKGTAGGGYEVRIEERRVATDLDCALHDARKRYEESLRLRRAGKFDEALSLAERVAEVRERLLGNENRDSAAAIENLANIYTEKGDYKRAESLYRRAFEIREKVLGKDHPDTAESLNDLAALYLMQGRYAEAESLFKRSLALREKSLGEDHPDTAECLSGLGVIYRRQGKYAEAESIYQRALAIREQALGKDHPDTAASLNNLAVLYLSQGRYEEAEPLYQRALAIRERSLGKDHPDTANSLDGLAVLYKTQGKYAEAESIFQRALAIREKVQGKDHPGTAASLNNLAELYSLQGKYGDAEALYQRVVAIFEKTLGPDHPDIASILSNLAGLYRFQGKYTEAEPLFKRALEIFEKALGNMHPSTAIGLGNLALLYFNQGKYADAEPLFKRALEIYEKRLSKSDPDITIGLNNLALLYSEQGKYAEAEELYQRALAINEKALGNEHPDTAQSLNNLAVLYARQGKYADAEPLYRRAIAIREKALGKGHPLTASSLHNLAALYGRQGKYLEAEPLYQRALAISERTLGQDHPVVVSDLYLLAALYTAKGDPVQAVKLQARANTARENQLARNLVIGSERDKLAYLATISRQTDQTISLHLHSAPADPAARNLAATIILQSKGRVLDATSQNLNALRSRFNAEDRTALDRLIEIRSQIAGLVLRKPQQMTVVQHQALIKELEVQAEQYEAEISRRSEEFRAQYLPVTLESVRAAIPPAAALIEFACYRPFNARATGGSGAYGQPRYVAYILRREGEIEWKELGEAKAIDLAVAALRRALRSPDRLDLKRLARAVDAQVFGPLRPLLGGLRQLLISPDGSLNLIPFAALVDERGRYAVERYSISYLTSGRDLLRLQVKRESKDGPLLVAGPDFGRKSVLAETRSLKREKAIKQESDRSSIADFYYPPLPGAVEEGEALRALLPGATLLTRRQATKAALNQTRGPRLLHIATHGFFLQRLEATTAGERGQPLNDDPERFFNQVEESELQIKNPLLRSALVLAGANEHKEEDNGILTALEMTGLNLWGTKLVTLSACDTGVGEVKNGDGVHGLRRALLLAGAETQVMSLWEVSDKATRELMVSYYRKLQQGEGRSEALRQVQLEMLKAVNRRHPFYWASFIPSGEWANLEGKRPE